MSKRLSVLLLCLCALLVACPSEPPDSGGSWNSSQWNLATWK